MTVSFTLISYSSVDWLTDLSCPMFTIESSELTWGVVGVIEALNECVNAGTVTGWPDDLDPKSQTDGRMDLATEYKELYEECKATLDWNTELSPDGDFSEACFWVRVNFK